MRVLVTDDHPIFRFGLKLLLREIDDTIECVESADLEEARAVLAKGTVDLVLLDLSTPGVDPMDALRHMMSLAQDTPVVVISSYANRSDAIEMIDLGAMGCIPKSSSTDEFASMLRVVLAGGLCLPKTFPETQPSAVTSSPEALRQKYAEHFAGLTKRQRQVLSLLAHGKSNLEIADALGVSDKTVRFYISAILKALKVRNRTQAALIAARTLEDPSPAMELAD